MSQSPINKRLFNAIRLGDVMGIHSALAQGADLTQPNLMKRSPLMWAAENGQAESARYLLSLNHPSVNPNELSHVAKTTALMFAAYNSHLECVELLIPITDLSPVNPDQTDALGMACLSLARGAENIACVEALMEVCDPTRIGQRGMDALSLAADSGNVSACVALLARCDPNTPNPHDPRSNALTTAAYARRAGCVEALAPACSFKTALLAFEACVKDGLLDVGETLLSARPDLLMDPQQSALRSAKRAKNTYPDFYAMAQARALAVAEMSAISSASAPKSGAAQAIFKRSPAHRL